jgi:hypothetical protein
VILCRGGSSMKEVEGVSCVQTLIVVLLCTPNCHLSHHVGAIVARHHQPA